MGSLRQGRCAICGIERPTLHRDHRVPTALDGPDDESNIQYLCSNCHEDKSRQDMRDIWAARTPEQKAAIIRKRNATFWANATPEQRAAHAERMKKIGASPWKKTTRSEAMKRAWETRRRNASLETRSTPRSGA